MVATQEIRFHDFKEYNYNWEMAKYGWGLCAKATIGSSINLGEFLLSLEAGYRLTWIESIEQTEQSTSGNEEVNKVMDLGLDGFISLLSFGINL